MPNNKTIHGLRGLAALLVFVYHVQRAVVTGEFVRQPDESSLAFAAVELGRLGVDLFFMISGLLIVASLHRHASIPRFLKNRIARIYPAFLVPHLIIFAVGPLIGYAWMADLQVWEWGVHFLSNLLMLPGVFPLPIAQIVAWSLSYELAFYFLAAAAFSLARSPNGWSKRCGQAVWLAVTALLLWYHPRGWFFVAGVAVYGLTSAAAERKSEQTQQTLSQPHQPRKWPGEAVLGLAMLVLMFISYDMVLPAAIICGGVGFWVLVRQQDALSFVLQTRPLQYFGTISYSFYLWHSLVLFGTKRIFGRGGGLLGPGTLNLISFIAVSLAGSVICAQLSYSLVEVRLTRRLFGKRQSAKRPQPLPTAQTTVRQAA